MRKAKLTVATSFSLLLLGCGGGGGNSTPSAERTNPVGPDITEPTTPSTRYLYFSAQKPFDSTNSQNVYRLNLNDFSVLQMSSGAGKALSTLATVGTGAYNISLDHAFMVDQSQVYSLSSATGEKTRLGSLASADHVCLLATSTTLASQGNGILEVYLSPDTSGCEGSFDSSKVRYFIGRAGAPSTTAADWLTYEVFDHTMQITGYIRASADYADGTIYTANGEKRATLPQAEVDSVSRIGPSGSLLITTAGDGAQSAKAYIASAEAFFSPTFSLSDPITLDALNSVGGIVQAGDVVFLADQAKIHRIDLAAKTNQSFNTLTAGTLEDLYQTRHKLVVTAFGSGEGTSWYLVDKITGDITSLDMLTGLEADILTGEDAIYFNDTKTHEAVVLNESGEEVSRIPHARWLSLLKASPIDAVENRLYLSQPLLIQGIAVNGETVTDPTLVLYSLHTGQPLRNLGALTGDYAFFSEGPAAGDDLLIGIGALGEQSDLYYVNLARANSLKRVTTTPALQEFGALLQ